MIYKDKKWLRDQYVVKKRSTTIIAKKCGCSRETVRLWLRAHEIPIRSKSERIILSRTKDLRLKLKIARLKNNSGGFKKGHKRTLGRKQPPEEIEMRKIINTGERKPNWKGGKSYEPYGIDFTKELKESIRTRDGYKCVLCKISQNDLVQGIQVHHIDYDKKNNDQNNLITLCPRCHGKTNENRRCWTKLLGDLIENGI